MQLKTYLDDAKLTLDEFGKRVGVSGVTVHRWATGKNRPAWEVLPKIAQATSGAVTAADFLPSENPALRGE